MDWDEQVEELYQDGLLEEEDVPYCAITIVGCIGKDGTYRHAYKVVGDQPLTTYLGLIELVKMEAFERRAPSEGDEDEEEE